ncbi:MAG TPA: branched-chain amino acid ABC transporter permease [Actinomycetota bacterium]|jgi:branched-chain amino acid transport system permease protein|nr:branched-chain amino acid ABC transporter permease [Actinomycetota bacterium]
MDEFLTSTVRGLAQGSLYVLLGLGFVIIYKGTRVVNFAHPALLLFGAYFVSYFAVSIDLNFWLALALSVVCTVLVAVVVERVALRPMVGEPPFSAAVVTVGVFIALQVIVGDLIGIDLRQVGDPWGLRRFRAGGVVIFHSDVAKLAMALLVVAGLVCMFRFTRAGLAMRATSFDQEVALAQGIPVGRMFAISWALAGGLAAVAGAFIGTGGSGVDQTTGLVALKALPAIILGGLDSIPGAIIGGAMIGLAEAYTKTYQPGNFGFLGANFDQVVPYIVMLIVLLIRPYGIFGTEEVERV